MITKGNDFKYFIDGKEVLYKDLQSLISLDMTVKIDGLNVYYSSPNKVKDRLILAEEFKKKALNEIYFKNPNFKKEQVSQACYTSSEEVKRLIKERQEYSDRLAKEFEEEEVLATILNSSLKVNEKRRDEWMLRDVDKFKFAVLELEKPKKEETVNRLVEEELERQEKNDSKSKGDFRGILFENWIDTLTGQQKPLETIGIEEITKIITEGDKELKIFGKKENNGKIDYSEIDFDILDLMANRFSANKHKYPHGNMLKPIEEKELLFALFRHLKKMIQPVDNDPETFEEHLSAILCNAQMVYQQRKLKNN